jgi:hypothetical protein
MKVVLGDVERTPRSGEEVRDELGDLLRALAAVVERRDFHDGRLREA